MKFSANRSSLYRKILGLTIAVFLLSGIGTAFTFIQNSHISKSDDMRRTALTKSQERGIEQRFIVSKDTAYVDSARREFSVFKEAVSGYQSESSVAELTRTFAVHTQLFGAVEAKLRERGLDENSGSEGALRKSVHSIESIIEKAALDRLQISMLSMRRSEKDFFLRGKDKYIDKVREVTQKLIGQTRSSDLDASLKQQIINLAGSYQTNFEQAAVHIRQVNTLADSLAATSSAMQTHISGIVATAGANASAWKSITIIAVLLSALVALFFALRMSASISSPVRRIEQAAVRIADGNTDIRLDDSLNDEIGSLAASFNTMIEKLRASEQDKQRYLSSSVEELVESMERFAHGDLTIQLDTDGKDEVIGRLYGGFNTAVTTMRSMLRRVIDTVAHTATASDRITQSTEQLASGAQQQASQTAQVAAAVEQMANSSIENSTTSRRATELAREYSKTAQRGEEVLDQTVDKLRAIAEVVHQSAGTIGQMSASGNRISDVVSTIDEIADQTNLLALNAAIEAARAGTHGRGFAVVADEVRKLAERTTQATREIAGIVRSIRREADNAVRSIQTGEQEATEGLTLADKAGTALSGIMATSDETLGIIAQIASANEEQSVTAVDIARNVDGIAAATEQAAVRIADIAEATEELNRRMDNLQELVHLFTLPTEQPIHHRHRNGSLLKDRTGATSLHPVALVPTT